jgi:hypothetical protein
VHRASSEEPDGAARNCSNAAEKQLPKYLATPRGVWRLTPDFEAVPLSSASVLREGVRKTIKCSTLLRAEIACVCVGEIVVLPELVVVLGHGAVACPYQ